MNASDLERLKGLVIAELGKVRADTRGFTSDSKSVFSWLRDKFMTFFMSRSASFHSETMFHINNKTTNGFRNLLTQSSTPGAPNPDISTSEIDGFVVVGNPSLAASATSAGEPQATGTPEASTQSTAGTGEPQATETPESAGNAGTFKIDQGIVENLVVIDTPRDGSCMLWALEIAKRKDFGCNDNERIEARDVTIPEYRQMISVGLRMEAANLRNKANASQAKFLRSQISNFYKDGASAGPEVDYLIKYTSILETRDRRKAAKLRKEMKEMETKYPKELAKLHRERKAWENETPTENEAFKSLSAKADELEARAQDMDLSGSADSATWFGAAGVEPSDMRFIAPTLGKDIAIITKIKGETIYYLCTKEGKFIDPRQPQGEDMKADDFKDRFEAALKAGPAIFAEDGHARAVMNTPSFQPESNNPPLGLA
jgi:hypothetical protein